MRVEDIKSFEQSTLVQEILSLYIGCKADKIMQCLVGDDKNSSYGLLDYWAELNRVEPVSVLDAIEYSLKSIADFSFISTSFNNVHRTANTVLKLCNDIIIPLEWVIK